MRPQVGVGIFIMNQEMNQFLISKRKDCDRYALMGGHLERYEQINECASRECLEESNLQIPVEEQYPQVFNVIREESKYHYITYFTLAKIPEGQTILNTEPDKHEDWQWFGEEEFVKIYKSQKLYYSIEMLFQSCNEDFNTLIKNIQNQFQ